MSRKSGGTKHHAVRENCVDPFMILLCVTKENMLIRDPLKCDYIGDFVEDRNGQSLQSESALEFSRRLMGASRLSSYF